MRHIVVSGVTIMSAVLRAQDGFDGGMVRAIFFSIYDWVQGCA